MEITPVMEQILEEVEKIGRVFGLYRFSCNLGIDYKWSRQCAHRLENKGLVTIRKNKRELIIQSSRSQTPSQEG